MTVTVVGAAGFIGRHLVRRLVADGREPWTPAKGEPDLLRRDLGLVYYCAGLTADYDRRPFDTVEAHASLVSEIIRADRFERLVYCSSTRLYDGLAAGEADEATPLSVSVGDPRSLYDLSKALGENLALARAGGRGTVARLSNVYSEEPSAPGFLSEWLAQAARTTRLTLNSSPGVCRDYIHVDDVVDALIAVARGSGVYNVAAGALTSNAEIARVFAEAGWAVDFTGAATPRAPPNASAARLAELGVRARPVEDVVGAYLRRLKA